MLWVLFGIFVAIGAAAQEEEEAVKAAMYLNGAASEEELDVSEIERLQVIGKVRVNAPGRNARAILSEYQLAALEDYRRQCGDILSWEELALVDGFGKEAVEALRPYLSLWSDNLPGAVDTVNHFKADILVRATEKNLGGKLKAGGKTWQAAGAVRSKAWGRTDYDWTAGVEVGNSRWSVLAGDFNVRYGQGIGIWSGFSMTSLSTIDAFIKRPTGIRPVCSFTPSGYRGLAGEYRIGRWSLAAFGDISGKAGVHGSFVSMKSQLGLTLMPGLASAHFALNYKGIDLAGEAVYGRAVPSFPVAGGDSSFATVLAGKFRVKGIKCALQARAIPSRLSGKRNGEYGAAAGAQWSSREMKLSMTADASLLPVPQKDPGRKQLRIYGLCQWKKTETLVLESKFSGRYRNWEPSRSDLRLDIKYSNEHWFGASRIEGDYCSGPGVLGFLETGYKGEIAGLSGRVRPQGWAAYFRIGAFSTSGWSSRIYCYERDAPGTFTVPAYYGKGMTTRLYGFWKTNIGSRSSAKLCLRAAYTIREAVKPVPSIHIQLEMRVW